MMHVWSYYIIPIVVILGVFVLAFAIVCKKFRNTKRELEKTNIQFVKALCRTVEAKDRYTNGHSERVARYSAEIARRMGKSDKEIREIYIAGLLHDVGKIRIPNVIINKNGALTDEEGDYIKLHPNAGYHILKGVDSIPHIADGARFHHERYDGKGYPNGLSGSDIPEIARIIAVADAYDAMASNRSYRTALPQEVVRSEIQKNRGVQFDPKIADIMIGIIDEDVNYEWKQENDSVKKVLIIDCVASNRREIVGHFDGKPEYIIYEAESETEGIAIMLENDIDLILLDDVSDEFEGLEALERILMVTDKIPVIMLTTDNDIGSIEKAAAFGVSDFLVPPVSEQALMETVINALTKEVLDE